MILRTIEAWGEWSWIALAAVLMAAEIVAPGYFLIWLGIAAAVTGALFLAVPAPWQVQIAVFAILALASVFGWIRFLKGRSEMPSDRPHLNRRSEALIGREFVLEEPIQSGRGRVRIADTVWAVSGPDCQSGARVRVTRLDGTVLVVEPV